MKLSIRTKLLSIMAVTVGGLAATSFFAYKMMQKIEIGGSIYVEVKKSNDLLADVLPPPEYILESYLKVLQIVESNDPKAISGYLDDSKKLQSDYNDRHGYWITALEDGAMKKMLLEESTEHAQNFFKI